MGQKTNPIGNRLGIIRGWDSNWYGGRKYADKIHEDSKLEVTFVLVWRKHLSLRL
jgi:small subunit ribosomal protein S3